MVERADQQDRTAENTSISPFDQAVIDFRLALADPTADITTTPQLLHICQARASRIDSPNHIFGRTIDPSQAWELRGLTFEGEVAANGDPKVVDLFRGARMVYEEMLVQLDPTEHPQIAALPNFTFFNEMRARRDFQDSSDNIPS